MTAATGTIAIAATAIGTAAATPTRPRPTRIPAYPYSAPAYNSYPPANGYFSVGVPLGNGYLHVGGPF